jgi:hypothetical protein
MTDKLPRIRAAEAVRAVEKAKFWSFAKERLINIMAFQK